MITHQPKHAAPRKPVVRHRVGTYNVQHGHPVTAQANMILTRFEAERLDVLAVLEAGDYVHTLARLAAAAGHTLLYVPGAENVISQAILVREGCEIGRVHSVDTPATYYAPDGSLRRSSCPLVAHIDGVVYVAVHAPVQAWVAGPRGRRFTGPIRRRIAYRRYINRLLLIFKRHAHAAVCMLGDWNSTAAARGPFSPYSLAKRAGARLIFTKASTGHGPIDGAVARGCHMELHVVPNDPDLPKSDHLLVAGTLVAA